MIVIYNAMLMMTREGEEKAMICFNFEAFIIIGSNDKNFWSEVATFEQFLANKQTINDPRFCRESLHFTLQNILRTDYTHSLPLRCLWSKILVWVVFWSLPYQPFFWYEGFCVSCFFTTKKGGVGSANQTILCSRLYLYL